MVTLTTHAVLEPSAAQRNRSNKLLDVDPTVPKQAAPAAVKAVQAAHTTHHVVHHAYPPTTDFVTLPSPLMQADGTANAANTEGYRHGPNKHYHEGYDSYSHDNKHEDYKGHDEMRWDEYTPKHYYKGM